MSNNDKNKKKRSRPKNVVCANPRCRKDKPGKTASCQWRKGWRPPGQDPVLLCNACGVRFSRGHWCPYCFFIYKSDDPDVPGNPWLHCRGCNRRVHQQCFLNDPKNKLPGPGEHFFCLHCVEKGVTEPQVKTKRTKLRSSTKIKKPKTPKSDKDDLEFDRKQRRKAESPSGSPKSSRKKKLKPKRMIKTSKRGLTAQLFNAESATTEDPDAEHYSDVETDPDNASCICGKAYKSLMIKCDGCEKYFHPLCVGLDKNHLPPYWYCPMCGINTLPPPSYPPGTPLERSPNSYSNYIPVPNLYTSYYRSGNPDRSLTPQSASASHSGSSFTPKSTGNGSMIPDQNSLTPRQIRSSIPPLRTTPSKPIDHVLQSARRKRSLEAVAQAAVYMDSGVVPPHYRAIRHSSNPAQPSPSSTLLSSNEPRFNGHHTSVSPHSVHNQHRGNNNSNNFHLYSPRQSDTNVVNSTLHKLDDNNPVPLNPGMMYQENNSDPFQSISSQKYLDHIQNVSSRLSTVDLAIYSKFTKASSLHPNEGKSAPNSHFSFAPQSLVDLPYKDQDWASLLSGSTLNQIQDPRFIEQLDGATLRSNLGSLLRVKRHLLREELSRIDSIVHSLKDIDNGQPTFNTNHDNIDVHKGNLVVTRSRLTKAQEQVENLRDKLSRALAEEKSASIALSNIEAKLKVERKSYLGMWAQVCAVCFPDPSKPTPLLSIDPTAQAKSATQQDPSTTVDAPNESKENPTVSVGGSNFTENGDQKQGSITSSISSENTLTDK